MNTINGDNPYFPVSENVVAESYLGASIRTQLAAMAMQGYISAGSTGMPTTAQIVQYAIETADALITELNKTQKEG